VTSGFGFVQTTLEAGPNDVTLRLDDITDPDDDVVDVYRTIADGGDLRPRQRQQVRRRPQRHHRGASAATARSA
jgi:hypothetical protein